MAIPLDRMVIETDCPYMAPEPFRGRRNDRAMFTACLRSWQSCGEFRRRKCRKLPWKTENGCTA